MKTWLILLLTVAIAAVLILGLSLLSSVAILGASKRYLNKERQRDADKIKNALPGTDCGACGLDSCMAYALECAEDHGFVRECPHLAQEAKEQMQTEFAERQKRLAERINQGKK